MNLDKTKVMFNEHPISVCGGTFEDLLIQLGWATFGKLRRLFSSPILCTEPTDLSSHVDAHGTAGPQILSRSASYEKDYAGRFSVGSNTH